MLFITSIGILIISRLAQASNSSLSPSKLHWYECPSNVVAVSTSSKETFEEYPFREVGLAIFKDFRIPCDGILVQWNFLTPVATVWGLHLAVFRPVNKLLTDFIMAGETYVNGVVFDLENETQSSWVSYRPKNPLNVKMGDFVGVFYDDHTVSYDEVPICSAIGAKNNALVALYSAEALNANRYIVSVKNTVPMARQPALNVLITNNHEENGDNETTQPKMVAVPKTQVNNSGGFQAVSMTPPQTSIDPRCLGLPKTIQNCRSWMKRFYYDDSTNNCWEYLQCNQLPGDTTFQNRKDCLSACWQFNPEASESDVPAATGTPSLVPALKQLASYKIVPRSSIRKPTKIVDMAGQLSEVLRDEITAKPITEDLTTTIKIPTDFFDYNAIQRQKEGKLEAVAVSFGIFENQADEKKENLSVLPEFVVQSVPERQAFYFKNP